MLNAAGVPSLSQGEVMLMDGLGGFVAACGGMANIVGICWSAVLASFG